MVASDTLQAFRKLYADSPTHAYFAPGRINLIGEHTDYNGGLVLPCALNFGTVLLLRKNRENRIRLATTNFNYSAMIDLDRIQVPHAGEWVNYPLGVIDQFIKKGVNPIGLDLLFSGDIPNGAGLSSSASIEMVTAVALNEVLDAGLDRIELIKMCKSAENEFVGMNCGIMDQFIVGMGAKDSALYLDCRTLDYELVPLELNDCSIVVVNTNMRRELAASKYNERVKECAEALRLLSAFRPLRDLSDLDLDEFIANSYLIEDEIIRKRAKHVISENKRVKLAVEALKTADLLRFGEYMDQSHQSLKEDYEVTGFELDTIVEEARKVEGVLGARMTGAGFGGCSVNLVRKDRIKSFIAEVGKNYQAKTGRSADFYIASTGIGAGRIAY